MTTESTIRELMDFAWAELRHTKLRDFEDFLLSWIEASYKAGFKEGKGIGFEAGKEFAHEEVNDWYQDERGSPVTCPECLKVREVMEELKKWLGSLTITSKEEEDFLKGAGKYSERMAEASILGRLLVMLGEIYRKEEDGN